MKPRHSSSRRGLTVVLVASVVLGALLALYGLEQWLTGDQPSRLRGSTMGTTYTVTWHGTDHDPATLKSEIERKLEAISEVLSNWRNDSWISRFNRNQSTEPIQLPRHARRVLETSLQLAERTDGALDPTLGRLIDAWGFGPSDAQTPPSDATVKRLLASVGHEKLTLQNDPPRITKEHPALSLNLSAVAKGYAVDALAKHLRAKGIHHFMVDIGGDVRAQGHLPKQQSWRIEIEKPSPHAGKRASQASVRLKDEALATSGDYRRYITLNGARYPHVLDPATGRPVRSSLASVSIIAPTAARADGLATACLVLGRKKARRLIENMPDAAGLFIERRETQAFRIHTTAGWNASRE